MIVFVRKEFEKVEIGTPKAALCLQIEALKMPWTSLSYFLANMAKELLDTDVQNISRTPVWEGWFNSLVVSALKKKIKFLGQKKIEFHDLYSN